MVAPATAAFADWSRDFDKLFGVPPMKRVTIKAGMAGKVAGIKAARSATGGDMRLSGIPRGKLTVRLSPITAAGRVIYLELGATGWTAKGLWGLATGGRNAAGSIFPRYGGRNGGRGRKNTRGPIAGRALKLPDGNFRASSQYTPQRRKPQAKTKLVAAAAPAASIAARKQLHSEIRKNLGGPKTYRYVMR